MNILIVGSGFSGSILARKIVEDFDCNVTLIEKRANVGGNMADFYDENGILIQKYGPHFINTNNYWIIDYLKKFSPLIPYDCSLLTFIDGKYMQLPFNFTTLKQLVGYENSEILLKDFRDEFKGKDRVTMFELLSSTNERISSFASLLYEKAFKTYTSKQWGIPIENIDKSVINRVQFCIGYDNRYLNKDFQYLPEFGFSKLFENMLNDKRIILKLNEDANKHISFENSVIKYDNHVVDLLIYTGAIDELFSYKFGVLPYRTLIFKYEYFNEDKHLPCEIISYPQAKGYTRSTEYKQFNFHCSNHEKTVVVTEYPDAYVPNSIDKNIPCYPIINEENTRLYNKYLDYSKKYPNLFLCGRLAEYKYYNMDLVIESTFKKYEEIKLILRNLK